MTQTLRSVSKARPGYRRNRRFGFSLLELLVVIAVTMALTALLMPALRHVHENAHRLICSAHLQQMGQAFYMYSDSNADRLPYSAILQEDNSPPDLMAARRVEVNGEWDGLGRLFAFGYCPSPECFYCPSHHGDHMFDRYAEQWHQPPSSPPIFTNYHYSGDVEWQDKNRRRSIDDGYSLVLATDGLRTAKDFNHVNGMNVLRGDGSVRWRDDNNGIRLMLPTSEWQAPSDDYAALWDEVINPN
jgi:competence protein ComGC